MLSDHEWATLRGMERQVLAEDPRFAQVFETRTQRLHRRPVGMSTLVVAVSLGSLVLIAGAGGGALAVVAVTVLIGLVWRCTNDAHRRPQVDRPDPERDRP